MRPSSVALVWFGAAALVTLSGGCSLLGESEARRRYRDLVATHPAPGPAPAVEPPAPPSEEEESLRRRPTLGVQDCMRLGVLRSVRLHGQAELVHQADLASAGAYGAFLPTAGYGFAYFRQESEIQNSFSPNETRTHRFTLRQSLFRGFADIYSAAAADDAVAGSQAELRAAKLDVAIATARAFYAVASIERAVATLEESLKLQDGRLAEVKARQDTGLARRTERLFVETERARTEADLAGARHDLAAARAVLAFHTGAPEAKLALDEAAPREPAPLAGFLERLAERPDLAALAHEVVQQEHLVGAARGELLPTIAATSNLYARREGFLERVNWDVTLGLDWSLFEGGRTLSRVRLAESRHRQAKDAFTDARRRAETEVQAAYEALRASLARIPALETRVASADENVRLLDAEYRAGLATNLEAVDAENARRAARLDLDRELFSARRLELELRAVSGDESLIPGPASGGP